MAEIEAGRETGSTCWGYPNTVARVLVYRPFREKHRDKAEIAAVEVKIKMTETGKALRHISQMLMMAGDRPDIAWTWKLIPGVHGGHLTTSDITAASQVYISQKMESETRNQTQVIQTLI